MENKQNKNLIIFLVIALIIVIILMLIFSNKKNNELNYTIENEVYTIENTKYKESEKTTEIVKIDVDGYGLMIAQLYPSVAPITVKNFQKLVSEEFYDGLIFHRVINNFMIQTGDPLGNGTGGSDKTIKGEFSLNGIKNDLKHERGVISMARRGANPDTEQTMNSASSQFFIVQKDYPSLDGNYAAFGKLLHGYDILDKIASVNTDQYDKPIKDIKINTIRFVNKIEDK